ncbi:MAG TPA: nuclear transport factor 2 family protein [Thermoanaerobaculia bacterium]|nr:nuclear transport factor 2 family protein [Thermoanaerobaculia bacterium]
MKRVVIVTLLFAACATAAAVDERVAIRQVLDQQVAGWNRGDLEAYMQGYWNSPDLTFFSGANVTHGWQPTLDRYRKKYQGEGKEMGTLTFADVTIDVIANDTAFVRGAWHLAMKQGDSPHGLFTLLMKKTNDGWKIVHDHSS